MIIAENEKTFKGIEIEIYKYVCSEGLKLIGLLLSQIDGKIAYDRDQKKYRDKGFRKGCIKTVMGEVEYWRRVYISKNEKGESECHYLLDEALELKSGVGQMSENLCEKIVEAACEEPYRKAAERINEMSCQGISHMGVWNVTQEMGKRVIVQEQAAAERAKRFEGTGEIETPVLFEEQDGIYLPLQGESRKKQGEHAEMKVGVAYSGWKKTGSKRYNTVDKVAYAGFEGVSEFSAGFEGVIAGHFNVDEIEKRVLNGDGAEWIKRSIIDESVHYQLDKYHRNRAIDRYVGDDGRCEELREMVYNNEIDKLLKTIHDYVHESGDNEERQKEHENYEKLLSYYTNNKEGLAPYDKRGLNLPPATGDIVYRGLGTMESNIFSLIGFRMKGRRANWSINGGNRLAKLLTLKVTGRLKQMLEKIGEPQPETVSQPLAPPLSAGKVPEKVGKGWNGWIKASIPSTMEWLKDLCKIRFPN